MLNEKTTIHSVSHADQRGAKPALGSRGLTPREAEVLFWISQGKSNHDIGVILGAKTGTICKHVEHIFTKLNVENRTAAAVVALEMRRSVARTSSYSKAARSWAAITGFITMHLSALWSDSCDLYDVIADFVA